MGHRPGSWRRRTERRRRTGINREYILTPLERRCLLSLTHLYTFNDGTATDSVGTANGTLFNGAIISNGRLQLQNAGITSGSSGTVQYVKLPNGILPASGSATLEVWYSTDSATPTWMRVFDLGNGASGQSYLYYTPLSSSTDSRVTMSPVGGASRTAATAAGTTYNEGMSTMAAVVVDAGTGTLSLYINGVFVSSVPLNGIDIGAINELNAYLGRSQFSTDAGFSGVIDEFRIYDEARSAAAIAADASAGAALWTVAGPLPPRQVENLDRGLIAMQQANSVYLSWRLLGTDPAGIQFNVYRSLNGGTFTRINGAPVTVTTDFVDSANNNNANRHYYVKAVINGVEQSASMVATLAVGAPARQYLPINLQPPPGGIDLSGVAYTYNANDASVADVNGNGQYEVILKWDPSDSKDNSQSGYTANTYIDCYTLEGTRLWRIDLGQNIRAGAHYTQFIAYDLDGDGKAEIAMRTAPGTIDGAGNYVLMGNDNPLTDYRNSSGYNLTSPEYLTIFNGMTGAAMITTALHPDRINISQWGDTYGNRGDRLLMAVAYLDGQRPSLVFGRGIFPGQSGSSQVRNEIVAYNYRGGQLTQLWWFKANYNLNNNINSNYVGQGTYDMIPADVDGDGKDEIMYGGMAIDDDGTPLYSTGLGHGDAMHVSDMDPTRPGLELFMPKEAPGSYGPAGGEYRDARTGQLLQGIQATNDVGRGVALEIDPTHPGYEFWATTDDPNSNPRMIYNVKDGPIYAPPSNMMYNFGIYWDADLESELLDGTTISDWNYTTHGRVNLVSAPTGLTGNNGTKNTPCLTADIFGDWREEVIWRTSDNTQLQIWSTTIPANSRMYTLMDDIQYREAIAWQNVGYNQPPHPSFFIGTGMAPPPKPNIYLAPSLPGDANRDGSVTFTDFLVLQDNYDQSNKVWEQGDFNGDNSVTFADFLALQNHYGQSFVPANLVPASQGASPSLISPMVRAVSTGPNLSSGLGSLRMLLSGGPGILTPRRTEGMPVMPVQPVLSTFDFMTPLTSLTSSSPNSNRTIIWFGGSGFGWLHSFPPSGTTFFGSGSKFFIGWFFPM